MVKTKLCKHCGRPFRSENGREYCSDNCRKESTKEIWRKANNKRYKKIPEKEVRYCVCCGKTFYGTEVNKYCSVKCRNKAINKSKREYSKEYYIRKREK